MKNHVASSVVTTILAGPFVTMQMAHCCNKERHVAMLQDVPYHVSIAMALVASARELGSCVGRLAELQDQVDLMAYLKRPGRHFEVSDAHIDTSVQNPPEMDLACKGSSRECLSPAFQSESGSGFEATSSGSLEVSSCSPVLHKERVGCGEHVHGRHTGSPFTSKRCRITQKSANADQSTNRKAEAAPSQNGNANTAEPVALNSSEEYIVFHDTCQDDDCSSLLDPATKLAGLDTGLPDQTSKRVRSPKLPAPSTDKDHIGGGSPRVPKFQSISCPVSSWMAIGSAKMEPLSLERSFPAPRISGSLNSDTPVAHNDGLYSSPMVRRKFQGTPAVFVVTPGLDEKHFCEQEWTAQADNAFSQESLAHSSWEEHETAIYNEMMVVFAHCAHHKGAGLVSPTVTFGRGLRVASGSPVPAPICRRPLPAPQRTMSSRKQGTKGIRLPRLESPL